MTDHKDKIPSRVPEQEALPKPQFMQQLSEDHPELALEILSRIPEWLHAVDNKSGIDGFGEAILNKMDYISKKEIAEFIDSIAEEVRRRPK